MPVFMRSAGFFTCSFYLLFYLLIRQIVQRVIRTSSDTDLKVKMRSRGRPRISRKCDLLSLTDGLSDAYKDLA